MSLPWTEQQVAAHLPFGVSLSSDCFPPARYDGDGDGDGVIQIQS